MTTTGRPTADRAAATRMFAGMERHQVAVYVGAMAAGAGVGLVAPGAGPGLELAINPVLGTLLYATFLQVPAADLVGSLRAGRFLGSPGWPSHVCSGWTCRPVAQWCSPERPAIPWSCCRWRLPCRTRWPSRRSW